MSIESQAEEIAKNAWLTGNLSRKINWQDEIGLYVLADDVLAQLTDQDFPGNPLEHIFVSKLQNPGTMMDPGTPL